MWLQSQVAIEICKHFQCPYLSLGTSQLATLWVALGENQVNCRILRVSHCQESITSRTFGGPDQASSLQSSATKASYPSHCLHNRSRSPDPTPVTCPPVHLPASAHHQFPHLPVHLSVLTVLNPKLTFSSQLLESRYLKSAAVRNPSFLHLGPVAPGEQENCITCITEFPKPCLGQSRMERTFTEWMAGFVSFVFLSIAQFNLSNSSSLPFS